MNHNLNAGGALAKGLEIARKAFYIEKLSQDQSVKKGLIALIEEYGEADPVTESGKKKSWDAVAGAFLFYTDMFPFATDLIQPYLLSDGSVASVEFSFSIPFPIPHPETGEPLLFVGRFDMLGSYMGQAFCVDEKTTGRIDSKWSEKWALRGQFIGYVWAARQMGYSVAGTIVRGVALYKEAYNIVEVPVYAPDWKVEQWLEATLYTISRMIEVWKSSKYRKNFGESCAKYGGCDYLRLCDTPAPERWYTPYYEVKPWNPLHKEEIES